MSLPPQEKLKFLMPIQAFIFRLARCLLSFQCYNICLPALIRKEGREGESWGGVLLTLTRWHISLTSTMHYDILLLHMYYVK